MIGCEDALTDPVYFEKVYREGCELTAYLCKLYSIDPKGDVLFEGISVPTILCHHDSYKYGLGTGHVDVDHWFPKYGKSMQTVRDDVAALLAGKNPWGAKEDETVTIEDFKKFVKENRAEVLDVFKEMMREYRKELQDNDSSNYSAAARAWAVNNGIIAGGDGKNFNGMWEDFITREQDVTLLYRFAKLIGKA